IDDEVKKLNNTMGVYDKRVTDIEYSYQEHNRRISDIEDTQKSKQKSNPQIIVALIGLIGGLGSAAFGLAQFFFYEVNNLDKKTNAIIKLAVLVVLLLNQALITLGYNPLPFSEEQIYEAFSAVLATVMAIYTWWTNNSVTDEAVKGDAVTKKLKNKQMTKEE